MSLAHTDWFENFMCVVRGQKQFTIVSPFQSNLVYAGQTSHTDDGFPSNYSPVNFDDYDENQ